MGNFDGSLASRLRGLRAQHGFTQKFVASRLDVHQATVSSWERGLHPVPPAHGPVLANLYHVSEGDLFDEPSGYRVPRLHLSERMWRRLRRRPLLPRYESRGTVEEMMALSPLAEDLYYRAVSRVGQSVVDALVEHLPRDSAHELLFALHLVAAGANFVRTSLASLGCRLWVVDGPKTRRPALTATRHVLAWARGREVAVFVPQPWLLIPRWNRCCRPDFLTVCVGRRGRPRWLDVEIDGRFHKDNEDVDAERAAALGLPRLGYATSRVRAEDLASSVWRDVTAGPDAT